MKWYGSIGFVETVETEPGFWEEKVIERKYRGEVTRNMRKLQPSGGLNDNLEVSNQISIIADPYVAQNFYAMRYVEFMGAKWKINNVEVQHPRLILNIGGLYNGNTTTTTV